MSAADPNVLALPKHARPGRINRGKLVRQGFVPTEGRVYGEWDLTQIEMVIFADDAQEERLLDAIRHGVDVHRRTASEVVFHKPLEEISDEERFAAKAVNFGILMGMTPFGLLDQLHKNGQMHWQLDMTEDVLNQWHQGYPDASKYIDRKHAEARQFGYVRDRWGRVRYLEGIHSDDKYIAAEAERQAQATPTQSGAQGLIKRAMAAAWPALKAMRADGAWVEILLQIHDALMAEYDPAAGALLDAILMTALCETVHLSVPVKAKGTMGKQHMGEL
jgi:DNA polymerase-1